MKWWRRWWNPTSLILNVNKCEAISMWNLNGDDNVECMRRCTTYGGNALLFSACLRWWPALRRALEFQLIHTHQIDSTALNVLSIGLKLLQSWMHSLPLGSYAAASSSSSASPHHSLHSWIVVFVLILFVVVLNILIECCILLDFSVLFRREDWSDWCFSSHLKSKYLRSMHTKWWNKCNTGFDFKSDTVMYCCML